MTPLGLLQIFGIASDIALAIILCARAREGRVKNLAALLLAATAWLLVGHLYH